MKRFFCTKCKRVRRTRRLPPDVISEVAEVAARAGVCKKHDAKLQPKRKTS